MFIQTKIILLLPYIEQSFTVFQCFSVILFQVALKGSPEVGKAKVITSTLQIRKLVLIS